MFFILFLFFLFFLRYLHPLTLFFGLQEEVARIWSSFLRLTQHNRAVFGEYYFDMTEKRIKEKEAKKSSPETKSADSANAHDKPKDIRWDALDLD